jgi:hypothetical protein
MAAPSAAAQRQMQQQMTRMMQEQMKQQEAMLKMQQQMHEQHMQKFHEWTAANGMQTASGSGGTGGGLPSNPMAMQNWLHTQKHNKALGKSYDPAYDQYLSFQKEQHATATAKPKATATAAVVRIPTLRPVYATGANSNASVSLLRTVHTRLQTTEQSYNGHRVRALNHITSALHNLGSSSPPNYGANQVAGNLAQGQSDAILQDALVKLQTVYNQIGVNGTTARHLRAQGAVSSAMQELNVALNVR